ncbi:MAG: hypothetical protein AAGC58_13765, partial [Asticcacaulis sp.]
MDTLYTIVVDYDGGTYISQVQANDVYNAMLIWCDAFGRNPDIPKKLHLLTHEVFQDLKRRRDEIVLLTGLVSVWCVS